MPPPAKKDLWTPGFITTDIYTMELLLKGHLWYSFDKWLIYNFKNTETGKVRQIPEWLYSISRSLDYMVFIFCI